MFLSQPRRLPLQLFQFFVRFGERFDREFQIFARMCGADLRANARGAVRHDWIEKADDVNAFLEHARGELLRFGGVADHDRHYRMHTGFDRQTVLGYGRAKIFLVLLEFVAQLGRCGKEFERFQTGSYDWWWDRV